jgi:hypothetical protein
MAVALYIANCVSDEGIEPSTCGLQTSHGEIAQVLADASRIAYQHMKDRGSVYVAGAEHEWEIAQTDGPISGGKGLQLDGVFST